MDGVQRLEPARVCVEATASRGFDGGQKTRIFVMWKMWYPGRQRAHFNLTGLILPVISFCFGSTERYQRRRKRIYQHLAKKICSRRLCCWINDENLKDSQVSPP